MSSSCCCTWPRHGSRLLDADIGSAIRAVLQAAPASVQCCPRAAAQITDSLLEGVQPQLAQSTEWMQRQDFPSTRNLSPGEPWRPVLSLETGSRGISENKKSSQTFCCCMLHVLRQSSVCTLFSVSFMRQCSASDRMHCSLSICGRLFLKMTTEKHIHATW